MTPNANDLVIRVRLDTVQAKQEWKKQEESAKGLGSLMGGALKMGLTGAAAGLSFVFGEAAGKSRANAQAVGSNLGRSTFLGQQIEKDTARRNAWESARSQTAQMFGAVGQTASKEQILGIFNALHGFEKREELGKQRVESLIDKEQFNQTMKDLDYLFNNFAAVMREFIHGMGAGRPAIK